MLTSKELHDQLTKKQEASQSNSQETQPEWLKEYNKSAEEERKARDEFMPKFLQIKDISKIKELLNVENSARLFWETVKEAASIYMNQVGSREESEKDPIKSQCFNEAQSMLSTSESKLKILNLKIEAITARIDSYNKLGPRLFQLEDDESPKKNSCSPS